jgi:hypothetical protein
VGIFVTIIINELFSKTQLKQKATRLSGLAITAYAGPVEYASVHKLLAIVT